MSRILVQYKGFLNYLRIAESKLTSWFGPHCNYDGGKMIYMAAKEWDGLCADEQKPFIHTNRKPRKHNGFINFVLKKDLEEFTGKYTGTAFSVDHLPKYSIAYKKLTDSEKELYGSINTYDLMGLRVIRQRDKLHQMYNPKDLTILEYILKTKPKKVRTSISWFLAGRERLGDNESAYVWNNLAEEEKQFYRDCLKVDRKRFKFEQKVWLTKALQIDFEQGEILITDLESPSANLHRQLFKDMHEMSRTSPRSMRKPKSLSSFAKFVREYSAQVMPIDEYPSRHSSVKDMITKSAEAWQKLPEGEKEKYANPDKDSPPNVADIVTVAQLLYSKSARIKFQNSINPKFCEYMNGLRYSTTEEFFAGTNEIPKKNRESAWRSLSKNEKKLYEIKFEKYREETKSISLIVDKKTEVIKDLIVKSEELRRIKRSLRLIKKEGQEELSDEET